MEEYAVPLTTDVQADADGPTTVASFLAGMGAPTVNPFGDGSPGSPVGPEEAQADDLVGRMLGNEPGVPAATPESAAAPPIDTLGAADAPFTGDLQQVLARVHDAAASHAEPEAEPEAPAPEPATEPAPATATEDAPDLGLTNADVARIAADPALAGLASRLLDSHAQMGADQQQFALEREEAQKREGALNDIMTAIQTPQGMGALLRHSMAQPQGPDVVKGAFWGIFADERGQLQPEAQDTLVEIAVAFPELMESVQKQLEAFTENPAEAQQWQNRRALVAQQRRLEIDKQRHQSQLAVASMAKAETQIKVKAQQAGLMPASIEMLVQRIGREAPAFFDQQAGGIVIPDKHLDQLVADAKQVEKQYRDRLEAEHAKQRASQSRQQTRQRAQRAQRTQRRKVTPPPAAPTTRTAKNPPPQRGAGGTQGPLATSDLLSELFREHLSKQGAAQRSGV